MTTVMSSEDVFVVARLSDTCSSCRWSVPVLNELHARLTRERAAVALFAEVSGNSALFAEETGLAWPTREFKDGDPERRERLPNIVVARPGLPPQIIEAEHFDRLDEIFVPGTDAEQGLVTLHPGHEALQARLAAISATALTLGIIKEDVTWRVTDELGMHATTESQHNATVAMSSFAAGQATEGRLDPVMALMLKEIRVFGSPAAAADVLCDHRELVGVHAQDYEGLLPTREPGSTSRTLRATSAEAVAAGCLARLSRVQRDIVGRRVWDFQRAASEADAERAWAVFRAMLDQNSCRY